MDFSRALGIEIRGFTGRSRALRVVLKEGLSKCVCRLLIARRRARLAGLRIFEVERSGCRVCSKPQKVGNQIQDKSC